MARALPSAIPPKMYRHFALVTVLLTTCIAMFADGENRDLAAAQVEEHDGQEALRQQNTAKLAKPTIVRRTTQRRDRFVQNSGGFDGFDAAFGRPMDRPQSSLGTYTAKLVPAAAQAGYSDKYLASLGAEERDLLLKGLEKEGLLSPEERGRKSAALIAASENRSGASLAAY